MNKVLQAAGVLANLKGAMLATWANVHGVVGPANARPTARHTSPRALIAGLGVITACVTALLPPVAYGLLSVVQLQQRAAEQATLGARHVEVQLSQHVATDWLHRVSISVLRATKSANSFVVASWLSDQNGKTVMFQGDSPWWPEFKARGAIRSQDFNGYFNIAVSTREVFLDTLCVTLGFGVLGFAVYYCFRRLPLVALDDAERLLQAEQDRVLAHKSQLETQNLLFEAALANMSQGLCMFDGQQRLVVCNAPYKRMYNLSPEDIRAGTHIAHIIGKRIAHGLHPAGYADNYERDLHEIINGGRAVTKIHEFSDGRAIAIKSQPMVGGGWIATHEDITEYRRIEARIAHMAHHDILTGLPNRMLLRERLERALEDAQKDRRLAVLCLDLDRFKDINDTLGHPIGDRLLKEVGERLRRCAAEQDTVARIGGDEFAIVQVAGDQPVAATALATRIIEALDQPFDLDGQQVAVNTSVGIAVAPDDGNDPDVLLKGADLALYRAKAEGRGMHRFFEPGMDAHMRARSKLQADLRKALANGEFELYYQPLVWLANDEISGFEALLRWHHPERGKVSPAEFIPLAEETGLIIPIGEWALRQACAVASRWPEHIRIAVNLSVSQFKNRHLVESVVSALAASGLAAQRLELEITETVLLHNNEATLATLHQLRTIGVRIALDDFGTGYSSLGYLRCFPFDKIKIDRCFVSDLSEASDDSLAILRAVASLGASLGIATTAEGVETKEQRDRVRLEGCTEMQGYFFSPPRPIEDISRLFMSDGKEPAAAA